MGVQPRRGCGRAGMAQARASFGTRLIFMWVQEYGAYYLDKVEIVRFRTFQEQRKEGAERGKSRRLLEHPALECSSVETARKKKVKAIMHSKSKHPSASSAPTMWETRILAVLDDFSCIYAISHLSLQQTIPVTFFCMRGFSVC